MEATTRAQREQEAIQEHVKLVKTKIHDKRKEMGGQKDIAKPSKKARVIDNQASTSAIQSKPKRPDGSLWKPDNENVSESSDDTEEERDEVILKKHNKHKRCGTYDRNGHRVKMGGKNVCGRCRKSGHRCQAQAGR